MMVDIIYSNSAIVPTVVSKIDPDRAKKIDPKASYGVRLDMFDAKGKYYYVLFDSDKNILKLIDHSRRVNTWIRSNRKNLIEKFKGILNIDIDNTSKPNVNVLNTGRLPL